MVKKITWIRGLNRLQSLRNVVEKLRELEVLTGFILWGSWAIILCELEISTGLSLWGYRFLVSSEYFKRKKISWNQLFITSLVNTLLSRNFCQISVTVNFRNFHTVRSRNFHRNSLSHFFDKNFVKATYLLKKSPTVDFTKYFFSGKREIVVFPRCAFFY